MGTVTTQATLTPSEFAAKWRGVTTTEKAGSPIRSSTCAGCSVSPRTVLPVNRRANKTLDYL